MIRSAARLRAHGRNPLMRLAVPVAAAVSMVVVAACSSYSGSGTGPYGSAPSGAPATHASTAAGAALTLRQTRLGTILTSGKGFTVYAFEADKGRKSACAGACAEAWPPVIAAGGPITVADDAARSLVAETTRPDGVRQLSYAGHPLYTYVVDTGPGATNGQGSEAFGARWDVLTRAGQEVTGANARIPAPLPVGMR